MLIGSVNQTCKAQKVQALTATSYFSQPWKMNKLDQLLKKALSLTLFQARRQLMKIKQKKPLLKSVISMTKSLLYVSIKRSKPMKKGNQTLLLEQQQIKFLQIIVNSLILILTQMMTMITSTRQAHLQILKVKIYLNKVKVLKTIDYY